MSGSESSSSCLESQSSEEELRVYGAPIRPYQYEPMASSDSDTDAGDEELHMTD